MRLGIACNFILADTLCFREPPPSGWGFIYCIRVGGKEYVGQTTTSVWKRFCQHRKKSAGSPYIKRALLSAAAGDVLISYVGLFLVELLGIAERAAIAERGTIAPAGYNLTAGGDGGPLSSVTRAKISTSRTGLRLGPLPQETKIKISNALSGQKKSAEIRARMSEAQRKRVLSPAARNSILQAHLGVPHTEEARMKMSLAHLGKHLSDRQRLKISAALKGRIVGLETRRALSKAAKRRYEKGDQP